MKKNIYILLLAFFFAFNLSAQDQEQTDLFGALPSSYGVYSEKEGYAIYGMNMPRSRHTWKVKKKLNRLRLTDKEWEAWLKKEYGNKELSAKEQMYYMSAKRKKNKQAKILAKYYADSVTKTEKKLSPGEQELLNKSKNDTVKLTLGEKVKLWNANRKVKSLEKKKNRYKLSENDSLLLEKAKNDTVKLSMKEKLRLAKVSYKAKKIQKHKEEEYAAQGGWTPTKQGSVKTFFAKAFDFKGKKSPSPYMKKLEKIEKKYSLNEKELEAYNKEKSNVMMLPKEKKLAKRAEAKIWAYNAKKDLIKKKYFMQLQDSNTKKRLKKNLRETARRYRKWFFKQKEIGLYQKMKIWLS